MGNLAPRLTDGENRKKKGVCNNAGETMVEVMVSAVIFLLFVAVLQSAVSFSSLAQAKSRQVRENMAGICRNLQGTAAQGAGSGVFAFSASSADESVIGNQVFTVDALKQTKDVSYAGADGTGKSVRFYVYGTTKGEAGGGESP